MKGLFATKTRIVFFCFASLLLIYSLLGFLIIPAVLKDQLPKITGEQFNRTAHIEKIEFNPFSMELSLYNFNIPNTDNSHFFSFKRLHTNISVLTSIKTLTLTLDDITLDEPSASIKRNKTGNFNFTDLLNDEEKPTEESTGDPFPLTIVKTSLSKGKVIWEDDFYQHPQKETIYPLNINLNQLTTKVNEQSQMEIDLALISGGELNWTGNLNLTPFSSVGKIKIDKLDFRNIWSLFLQDSVNFEILNGTETIAINYQLNDTEQGLQFLINDALIHLTDLTLSEKNKKEALMTIPTFTLSGIDFNLLDQNVVIDKISADTAQFKAWLNTKGVMNYETLFSSNNTATKKTSTTPKTSLKSEEKPWSITLNQLALSNFALNFVDHSLVIPAIFNLSSLSLNTKAIKIDYEDKENGLQLLTDNALINFSGFTLLENNQSEPLVDIPDFKVSGIAVNLLQKKVAINHLSVTKAKIKAWLNSEGVVNYQSMFSSESTTTEEQPTEKIDTKATESIDQAWSVTLAKLGLSELSFHFTDNSLKTPAVFDVTSLNFNASELSSNLSKKIPFDLALTLNNKGHINIDGQTIIEPFSSDLKVSADTLALKDFQPYIDPFLRLKLISGLFNINANMTLAQKENQPFNVELTGESQITNLVTRDSVLNQDFLKWKQLSVKGIKLNLAKNSYHIGSIKLDKPYARIIIKKDKSMNVTDLVIDDKAKENSSTQDKEDDNVHPVQFKIAEFDIVDGISDFSDHSLILPFKAYINQLKGSVKGISSDKNAIIDVALKGKVADLAPVNIKGTINPHQGNSSIIVDFKGMPLPLMTPYMAEFAGRKIEKGNMSLNLKYTIKDSQLTASNNLLIEQLRLGESIDNPKAVSLPLDLAIALLEDSKGKIKLDMPITGSLDDPQFSVTKLIANTLFNVLTKIISSPFNAIASASSFIGIGSDTNDISKISFLSGQAELEGEQKDKIDGIAKALADRPALNIEIQGTAFSNEDWPSLQNEALNHQLLALRAEKLSQEQDKTILPAQLNHSKEENNEALANLFIQQYPALAQRSLFGTPQLIEPKTGDFYTVARDILSKKIKPNTQRLKKLAAARAQAIAKHLSDHKIAVERIYLLSVLVDPKDSNNSIASHLNLTVK